MHHQEEIEIVKTVQKINEEIYLVLENSREYVNFDLNDRIPELSYSYNGFSWSVEFLGFNIFCSENDLLEFDETKNEYSETFDERFRREIRLVLAKLNNLKKF